jgi:hypothetical protein
VPVFVLVRTDTSPTDRPDLGSVGSAVEVASHPSHDSYELSSIPSDAELEKPEPTEAGDVTVLDTAEGKRLPLPRTTDSDETIKPKASPDGSPPAARRARAAAHDG